METTNIESITIVSGKFLSPVDRAKNKIDEEDFAELRVVRNSPRALEIKKIDKGVKPTEGFRLAITRAGLLNETFN